MRWPFGVLMATGLLGVVGVAGLQLAVTYDHEVSLPHHPASLSNPQADDAPQPIVADEASRVIRQTWDGQALRDDGPAWPTTEIALADGCRTAVATGPNESTGSIELCLDETPPYTAVAEHPATSSDDGIHPPALAAPGTPASAASEAHDSAITRLITAELPAASPDERRIWADELRGLDPAVARDLLRLRRQLGGVGAIPTAHVPGLLPGLPTENPFEGGPAFDPFDPLPVPLPAEVAERLPLSPRDTDPLAPTMAAFDEARLVLLNNMANANTPGFKRLQVLFEDQPYARVQSTIAGELADAGTLPTLIGHGVAVAATQLDLTQGEIAPSAQPLDIAIQGDGFFEVEHDGQTHFTRVGRFTRSAEGLLMFVSGRVSRQLQPAITIPVDAASIEISPEGVVKVTQPGSDEAIEVGQILLTRFANPALLIPVGGCVFDAGEAGEPLTGPPGSGGCGTLRQRALEASNVDLDVELAKLEQLEHHRQVLRRAASLTARPLPPSIATNPEDTRR